jgi:predicted phage tail protein
LYDDNSLTGLAYPISSPLADNKTYFWRVRSINANGEISSWSSTYSFRTALVQPVLNVPDNGSTPITLRPTFSWSSSAGAVNYSLVVSTYANLSTPVINIKTTGTSYTPTADLPAGKVLYWRVMANGVNPSAWSTINTITSPRPPSIPVLSSPASNALLTNTSPTLTWKASTVTVGAAALANYHIQVDDNADFSSPLYDDNSLTGSTYPISTPLADNKTYYWRVRAINTSGEISSWSSTFSFRTVLVQPMLSAPDNGSTPTSLRPTFSWSSSAGAVNYSLVVSTYANLTYPVINIKATGTSYTPTADLPAGKVLYWRVMANGSNPSAWSTTNTITSPRPPSIPLLNSPTSNALLTSYTPTLKWNASTVSSGAAALANYHIQVDDNADFASPLYDDSSLTGLTYPITTPLAENTKYYWRVRAINASGETSSWSNAFYFRTAMLAPSLLTPAEGASLTDTTPDFSWSAVDGVGTYSIEISINSNLTSHCLPSM